MNIKFTAGIACLVNGGCEALWKSIHASRRCLKSIYTNYRQRPKQRRHTLWNLVEVYVEGLYRVYQDRAPGV
ncbi:hypothetical protein BJX99DRAFT_219867 [Aspergillus californicus]